MAEVAEAAGPEIDVIQKVGEWDQWHAAFQPTLEVHRRLGHPVVQGSQMEFAVVIDCQPFLAADIEFQPREQLTDTHSTALDVLVGRSC